MNAVCRPLALCLTVVALVSVTLLSGAFANPPRAARERAVKAVVELVALEALPDGAFSLRGVSLDGKRFVQGRSSGSGTVISSAGLILTNAHVVAAGALDGMRVNAGGVSPSSATVSARATTPAPLVEVRLTARVDEAAKPLFLARVVRFDATRDLAVLQVVSDMVGRPVPNLNLEFLELGSSQNLMLGDEIAVIGYPVAGGRTITFTGGRVSGFVGEDFRSAGRAYIKTDAKFSSGASGGAALDDDGRLIGVPTAMAFDKQGGVPQESQNYLRPASFVLELLRGLNDAPTPGAPTPEPSREPANPEPNR